MKMSPGQSTTSPYQGVRKTCPPLPNAILRTQRHPPLPAPTLAYSKIKAHSKAEIKQANPYSIFEAHPEAKKKIHPEARTKAHPEAETKNLPL